MKIKAAIAWCCLVCLTLLFGCSSQPARSDLLAGRVTRVVSGQTVEVVLTRSSEITKIRIIGIDAPDFRQSPWGKAAQQKLTELTLNSPVLLEVETKPDRYQRLHAHLWRESNLIARELVESGCVLVNESTQSKYSKLLMESQEYARLMGNGIWNPERAMRHTPSQFRSMNKK